MPISQHSPDDAEPLRQAYRQIETELETAKLCRPHFDARIEELTDQLTALGRRIAMLPRNSESEGGDQGSQDTAATD